MLPKSWFRPRFLTLSVCVATALSAVVVPGSVSFGDEPSRDLVPIPPRLFSSGVACAWPGETEPASEPYVVYVVESASGNTCYKIVGPYGNCGTLDTAVDFQSLGHVDYPIRISAICLEHDGDPIAIQLVDLIVEYLLDLYQSEGLAMEDYMGELAESVQYFAGFYDDVLVTRYPWGGAPAVIAISEETAWIFASEAVRGWFWDEIPWDFGFTFWNEHGCYVACVDIRWFAPLAAP
jgi:hypothetical protein